MYHALDEKNTPDVPIYMIVLMQNYVILLSEDMGLNFKTNKMSTNLFHVI
jgi:hypothetical protein